MGISTDYTALGQFFNRQEERTFPTPKYCKPYSKIATRTFGWITTSTIISHMEQYRFRIMIRASHKESGSGKIELLINDLVALKLYLQGVTYDELIREMEILYGILNDMRKETQKNKLKYWEKSIEELI